MLEGGVEVVGAEVDAVHRALGHERGDHVAVGRAAVQVVREDDLDAGLRGGADGDPAEALAGDVVPQFQPECIAVEGQYEIGVMDLNEASRKREVHARHTKERAASPLPRSRSADGWGG